MSTDPDAPSSFLGLRLVSQGPPARVYRLESLLGSGSQALVFAARAEGHVPLAPLAIKVFRPSFLRAYGAQAELVAQKELFALGRLPESAHVVRLLDQGSFEHERLTIPWLVLERVDGVSLQARVDATRQRTGFGLEPRRALRVLGHAAEGLRVLHEAGIVHRDVKPTNVLVSGMPPEEQARVADFGVCRPQGFGPTFGVGAVLGAPGYAAPELADPSRVGPRSDVFSFGALVYHALSGEPMFQGSSFVVAALVAKEAHAPLASRASVHPAFVASGMLPAISDVLRRATRHDPAQRIAGMRALWTELGGAIARAVQHELGRGEAPPPPSAQRVTRALQLEDDDDEGRR